MESVSKTTLWRRENPDRAREQAARYRANNREKLRQLKRQWRLLNPSAEKEGVKRYQSRARLYILEYRRRRYALNRERECLRSKQWVRANPEKARLTSKLSKQRNKAHANAYRKLRFAQNGRVRMRYRLGARISKAVRHRGGKWTTTPQLIGCSLAQLCEHLESQFTIGMSWQNYGVHGWHVDHIIPCAAFDLTREDQQRACFHYSNLQPLWAADNLRKQAKYCA